MTARRTALADLPDWPAGLSREQAAAYVGLSPNTFILRCPVKPLTIGGRKIWRRRDLDAWLAGQQPSVEDTPPAGERSADDWLGRLDNDNAHSGS